ncbi:MAG: hypothetical protein COV34_00745 [Candidatus Zambryskibacteria bacterium CG10_big_fil_rev_8_21_14_0_10_42_12]|uniref:Adenylate kinase n=1 Tax=Candidatus Zambryskibacteria bacterium CG10_big_fil_rev_8_21_14_0_10_42_12 TaxID=1975115 RepID=A0A2H0QWE1_9BACT|nr:MAG: hypothetical protein COV34_00745 [Candidatus Zambryskibacteria bacterium CG10_big_fil_rev_8_21_14_0_10_42_12]
MEPLTIILLGSQGSGKGTQAKLLTDALKAKAGDMSVFSFESGAHFRTLMSGENYTAELVRKKLEKGDMLPDFFPIWMWTDAFMKNLDHGEHIILDGFPRTVTQAKVLNDTFAFYERTHVYVIDLEISPAEAEKRLIARGRADDTPEGIQKRLAWYETQVKPVIEFYKEHDDVCKFVQINGEQAVEDVHRDIVKALNLE